MSAFLFLACMFSIQPAQALQMNKGSFNLLAFFCL
jgi:hypothetical protein